MRSLGEQRGEDILRTNEETLDRVIRVVLGVGVLSLLLVWSVPGWRLIGLVGLIPLIIGLTGYHPTYVLLGGIVTVRRIA